MNRWFCELHTGYLIKGFWLGLPFLCLSQSPRQFGIAQLNKEYPLKSDSGSTEIGALNLLTQHFSGLYFGLTYMFHSEGYSLVGLCHDQNLMKVKYKATLKWSLLPRTTGSVRHSLSYYLIPPLIHWY